MATALPPRSFSTVGTHIGPAGVAPAQQLHREIRFRRFVLLPGQRRLLRDGEPVTLGSRAFDLLHTLARTRGQIVSKEAIVSQVWPTTYVEESNLRMQIAMLRKALGDDRDVIKTVPGRGYMFAAEASAQPAGFRRQPADPSIRHPLVEELSRRHGLAMRRLAQSHGGAADEGDPRGMTESLRAMLHSVIDEMWEIALRDDIAACSGCAA